MSRLTMHDSIYLNPLWAVIGFQDAGKCIIMASKTLTRGELELIITKESGFMIGPHLAASRSQETAVKLTMIDWVMISADTWEHAWRGLFEDWSPEPDRQLSISRRPIATELEEDETELEEDESEWWYGI